MLSSHSLALFCFMMPQVLLAAKSPAEQFFAGVLNAIAAELKGFSPPEDADTYYKRSQEMDVKLPHLQEEALVKGLRNHGYLLSGDLPITANLIKLSDANYRRLRGRALVRKDFEDIIQQININFVHNRSVLDDELKPTGSLFSSKALEVLGVPGGVNSESYFNTNILNNDDQVYFFPIYQLGNSIRQSSEHTSSYGKQVIGIDQLYAFKTGWVSAFVMYSHELGEYIRHVDPVSFDALIDILKHLEPEEWAYNVGDRSTQDKDIGFIKLLFNDPNDESGDASERRIKAYASHLRPLKEKLHSFDFTPRDFLMLVRETVRDHLVSLSETNQEALAEEIKNLQNERIAHQSIESILRIKYPFNFEFKIPFAVPRKYYRVRQRQRKTKGASSTGSKRCGAFLGTLPQTGNLQSLNPNH